MPTPKRLAIVFFTASITLINTTRKLCLLFQVCGVNYCKPPTESIGDDAGSFKPDKSLVIKLLSIYLGCGVFAILLVSVLLDRLTGNLSRKKLEASSVKLLIATVRHLRDRRMLLILPLTFFSGLEQAFIFADYTAVCYSC